MVHAAEYKFCAKYWQAFELGNSLFWFQQFSKIWICGRPHSLEDDGIPSSEIPVQTIKKIHVIGGLWCTIHIKVHNNINLYKFRLCQCDVSFEYTNNVLINILYQDIMIMKYGIEVLILSLLRVIVVFCFVFVYFQPHYCLVSIWRIGII